MVDIFVAISFGVASLLSIYGCSQFVSSNSDKFIVTSDSERVTYVAPILEENANPYRKIKGSDNQEEHYVRQIAGISGNALQILYQTCAGAALLTDIVFWVIIFPFLTYKEYTLYFLLVGMHSVNIVFLLGDTTLNCLWFPWFEISYYVLWTAMFVIFQWIIHACISLRYLAVALLHIPCYAIFVLIIQLKCYLLSTWFPRSHQYPI